MLADFGNAVLRDCTLNFTGTTRKNSLSPRWAVGRFISDDVLPTDALSPKAPELLDEREGTYSREADVYALGMTVLETFTGQVPYHDKSDHRVMIIVVMLKEPPTRPEAHIPFNNRHGNALWWLLNLCWANEPGKRPKASEVVELMNGIKGLDLSVKEGLSELEKRLQAGVAAMRATIKFAPISPVPAYPSVARVGYSHAGLTPAGPTPVGATVRSRAAFYPGIQAFLAARARSFKAGPARFHPAAARVGPTPIRTYPLVPVRPTARVNPDKTQHKQSIMQKILAYLSLD
ncbi:hypothetical protein FS749_016573 [Ceratobasidium sp. UAMH 11750]|nr:hypothetical protein FS749_016573 [Ceratobasidium sp. UAMH 11750]